MLDRLLETAAPTQQSQVAPGPLPEFSFIASSRDPLPLPRASRPNVAAKKKKGKAAVVATKQKEKAGVAAKKKKGN